MKFRGSFGKLYRLSEIHQDIHAYVRVDDTIVNEVKYYFLCLIRMKINPYSFVFQIYRSEKPELREAQLIIDKILKREIPMKLVQYNYSKLTFVSVTEIYLFAQ